MSQNSHSGGWGISSLTKAYGRKSGIVSRYFKKKTVSKRIKGGTRQGKRAFSRVAKKYLPKV